MIWTVVLALIFFTCHVTLAGDDVHLVAALGDVISLPCSVDTAHCGEYHSIKWYKGGIRVAVYSQLFKHAEDDLEERAFMTLDDGHAYLTIKPVEVKDEGDYKCETTYLDVSKDCQVVQFIRLKTVARPGYIRIALDSVMGEEHVTNSMIGPYNEGSEVVLVCESGGGKPTPRVRWVMENVTIEGKESIFEHSNLTGTGKSEIRINVNRKHLGSRIQCIVENEAIIEGLTAFVQIDVNLGPFSTVITGDQAGMREELPSVLVCVSAGARPAAVIIWYKGSIPLLDRDTHPVRHMAILQADGTYITRSRIVLTPTRFDHNRTIQCRARNEVLDHLKQEPQKDNFTLHVNYSPVVSMISRTVFVNES